KIWEVGGRIVQRTGVKVGERVLDVACGTGNATIPAAEAGAEAVGLDLTPELLEDARRRAAEAGVAVEWLEGDAEALPFDDGSFDVVLSTFGVMFAPRHEVAAAELARVLRPGGRLGLCSWTPDGEIGDFFKTVASHAPPPQAGAPPARWGEEAYLRDLFADLGVDLELERDRVLFRFDSIDETVETYAQKFGPVVKARERTEAEGRWPALRKDLAELFARHNQATDGSLVFPGEYLVAVGRRVG
ncbi:MAG TPA: class I SAM-dependent methyltransferase, partial [Planctomycetaceae bacterium]